MAQLIADFQDKVRGLLKILQASEPLASQVLALCNKDRVTPEATLRLNIMADAIGFSPSNFNNWTNTGHSPRPGRIFDFVALLGMVPEPEALSELELEHMRATERSPYPDEIYQMMERWIERSPAARCWAAFAGSKVLAQWHELRKEKLGLGTSAADFLKIYGESLPDLKPQLLDTVHWEKKTTSRIMYRLDHSKVRYVLTGDTDGATRSLPQLARLNFARTSAAPAIQNSAMRPAWLDPHGPQPLLDLEMPTIGRSAFEIEEKAALYGGRRRAGFSALEHVVAGHAFERETVLSIAEEIHRSESAYSSFTLCARPGGGLSIALAQLTARLSSDTETRVFWIIGDADRTRRALSALSYGMAEEFVTYCLGLGDDVARAVVVIDDVSLAPHDHILRLIRFMQRCKVLVQAHGHLKLTFVFGSFGATRTCSEDKDIELSLSQADETACYNKMARHEPAIIEDRSGGLTAIITAHPEARWYKNDAQALIDFLLEHGNPKAKVMEFWLARTDYSDETERRIVERVAVAQLIGLSLPEPAALELFAWRVPVFHEAEDIVEACKYTAVVNDEWLGVGLSCPRRAKSILARSGQFSRPFLGDIFCEIVAAALRAYEAQPRADDALDFARHIFQRLSKRQLYVFPDKSLIVERLTQQFGERLRSLSSDWSPIETANWAGTLSGILLRADPKLDAPTPSQIDCANLVLQLSRHALAEVSGDFDQTGAVALSLLRASTRLLACKIMPDHAQSLAYELLQIYTRPVILELIQAVLLENKEDRSYRANELLHAFCRLEGRSVRGGSPKGRYFEMSKWLGEASRLFGKHKAALDAGSLLQRARYVWIHGGPRRVHDLNFRAIFIRNAHDSIEFHPQAQGTWALEARRAQSDLERDRMK